MTNFLVGAFNKNSRLLQWLVIFSGQTVQGRTLFIIFWAGMPKWLGRLQKLSYVLKFFQSATWKPKVEKWERFNFQWMTGSKIFERTERFDEKHRKKTHSFVFQADISTSVLRLTNEAFWDFGFVFFDCTDVDNGITGEMFSSSEFVSETISCTFLSWVQAVLSRFFGFQPAF